MQPPENAEPAAAPAPQADRRSILRQLSGDAVWTAGRLAGASAALRRSLVAAGETAIGTLEAAAKPEITDTEPVETAPAPPPPASPDPPSPPVVAGTAPASEPTSVPDPVGALTPTQHAFLAGGTTAALAVNDPGGPPLLASSMYHWDGAVVRVPARDFTARTIDIDRDPRVSLLIEDPTSDAWVAISGIASLVYGHQVEPEMRLILGKYHDQAEATIRWESMRSSGDQLVIVVRPTRFVWRPA